MAVVDDNKLRHLLDGRREVCPICEKCAVKLGYEKDVIIDAFCLYCFCYSCGWCDEYAIMYNEFRYINNLPQRIEDIYEMMLHKSSLRLDFSAQLDRQIDEEFARSCAD